MKFLGNKINGKKEGFGIQEWQDGSSYIGIYKNSKSNGFGKFIHPNGDFFKGI